MPIDIAALDVRNTQDRRCVICHVPDLFSYDKRMFLRQIQHSEFARVANDLGFQIPESDFRRHMERHVFVYQEDKKPEEMEAVDLLDTLVLSIRTQLDKMEMIGDVQTTEYNRKLELLQRFLELKGKFAGDVKEKVELSTDFKSMLVGQLEASTKHGSVKATKIIADKGTPAITEPASQPLLPAPVPVMPDAEQEQETKKALSMRPAGKRKEEG